MKKILFIVLIQIFGIFSETSWASCETAMAVLGANIFHTYSYSSIKGLVRYNSQTNAGYLVLDDVVPISRGPVQSQDISVKVQTYFLNDLLGIEYHKPTNDLQGIPIVDLRSQFKSDIPILSTKEGELFLGDPQSRPAFLYELKNGAAVQVQWLHQVKFRNFGIVQSIKGPPGPEVVARAVDIAKKKEVLAKAGLGPHFYGLARGRSGYDLGFVSEIIPGHPCCDKPDISTLKAMDSIFEKMQNENVDSIVDYDHQIAVEALLSNRASKDLSLIQMWATQDGKMIISDLKSPSAFLAVQIENLKNEIQKKGGPHSQTNFPPNSALGWFTYERALVLMQMDPQAGIKYIDGLRSSESSPGAYRGLIGFLETLIESGVKPALPYKELIFSK